MPNLILFVIGDEAAKKSSLLTDSYYDVVIHGEKSWLYTELLNYLYLIKSQSFDYGILSERYIVNEIMTLSPRVAELTTLLQSRISSFYMNFQVDETGQVVSIGDDIARVYGLNKI